MNRLSRRRPKSSKHRIRPCAEALEARALLSGLSALHSFTGNLLNSGVIMDAAGDLFGTNSHGGTYGDGAVFEIANGTSSVTTLASLNNTDGSDPQAGVIVDSNGNLFGTAQSGGAYNDGTVFEIANGTSNITTVASFNGTDGADPAGALMLDSSGDLLGTTSNGGVYSDGTVFEIANGSSSLTSLVSFNETDGGGPSGVIQNSDGDLFGKTGGGGAYSDGTVFEITEGTNSITALASFNYGVFTSVYGVTLDSKGDLFGTTSEGGTDNWGTVFEIANGANSITTFASFNGADGGEPYAGVTLDSSGDLFGTTFYGPYFKGTVFEIANGTSSISTLATFNVGSVGYEPGVSLDSSGNLFGTTEAGGTYGGGTVFEITRGTSVLTSLASFDTIDGVSPTFLVQDSGGNLFGTTEQSGAYGDGTIFEIADGTSSYTTLASFNRADGSTPNALTLDSSGNLFGTTQGGGAFDGGTIFEIALGTSSITTLASFNGTDGDYPKNVILDSSGDLFGSTYYGGPYSVNFTNGYSGYGTIFELANGSTGIITLASFNGTDGYNPNSVILDSSGDLFGTTAGGVAYSANSDGNVFELAQGASTISILASFNGTNGADSRGGLILDSGGDLIGTTASGGEYHDGTVFKIAAGTSNITTLVSAADGADPTASVSLDSSGDLFGTTGRGGTYNNGTVFEIVSGTSSITTVASFNDTDGAIPEAGLVVDSSGILFGAATEGGSAGYGTVFELTPIDLAFAAQPTNATAGAVISPSITVAIKENNKIVTADQSVVTLALASGPGTLGGTLTAMAINGIATFSTLSITTAGNYTLAASDLSDGLNGFTSHSFTIGPSVASKLVFTVLPQNAVAGEQPPVVVAIEDQYNNTVTTDNSVLYLSLITIDDHLMPGVSSGQAVNGVATFGTLSITTVGDYNVMVADVADDISLDDTAHSFSISAAAPSKLIFHQQPGNAVAGNDIAPSVVVYVEDTYGNLVTGNTSGITMALASGSAALGGTLARIAVNGVATFANLFLDKTGTYSIAAKDTGLTAATSSKFTISPAAASKLVFTTAPKNAAAGKQPPFVVTLEDKFGNIAKNATVVTLGISSGPTNATMGGTTRVAATNGAATFNNIVLSTLGTYKLAATDGTLSAATSGSFAVNSNTATKLVFIEQPTAGSIGLLKTVQVAVENSLGEIILSDSPTITMALGTGTGGTLGGTLKMQATNGVATFSKLSLSTNGTYTLKASEGALFANSARFVIA